MSSSFNLVAFVCLVMLLNSSFALKCYVCNSMLDDNCSDDPSKDYIFDCQVKPRPDQPLPEGNYTEPDSADDPKTTAEPEPTIVAEPDSADDPKTTAKPEPTTVADILAEEAANSSAITYTLCRKAYQVIQGKTRVYRGCGYIKHKRECVYTTSIDVKNTNCECESDECNTSTRYHANLATCILSTLLFIVINRLS